MYRRAHFVMFVVIAAASAQAFAQSTNRATEFEDLGLTLPLTPGARGAGLAGAYVTMVNDAQALAYNPAGLARIGRIETSLGLAQDHRSTEVTFYGTPSSIATRAGAVDLVSVAVPMPVLRGSFVPAFGVVRMYSSYLDVHYSGDNLSEGAFDNYLLQQTGSIYAYTVGLGMDLSEVIAIGGSFFILDGDIAALRQHDYHFMNAVPSISVFVSDDAAMDVDGLGGRVGAQFYPHPLVRAGVNITTPILVDVTGNALTEVTEHVDNNIDSFKSETRMIDTEYVIPYRIDAGAALVLSNLSIAAEVGYSDWTQASIDGRRLRNQNLETIFKEVLDVRGGAEWSLPWWPIRLRGGYASRPIPMKFFQEDRIDNDRLQPASESSRTEWSVGLGGLIGRTVMIDGAYIETDAVRGTENVTDRRTLRRFVVSASYRF